MDINNIVNSTRTRNARLLDDINNKILNREYYKFRYLPFEGALPGLYFQQQTEDAINDIGNVAYATEQVADEALKIAQQAYNIALAALETANNALAAAQTAQQTADTALSIANNALSVGTSAATAAAAAQKRADEAYDLADAAKKAADAAQNTADAAQEAANSAANDATNALTKAESALTKIEQLSVLNYYNNVTEATDVNTLVDIRRWYLQASNNPNAPETNPGFLNVDNDYNDSVCKQLWVSETTGAIYNRFGQIVENSDPATVSSWSEWYKLATKADIDGTTTDLTKKITTVANNLATHEADFNNPHKVTAEQLGLTTVYQYKGSVATYADLPTTGQKVGDVWNVETADPDHGIKAGDNVAWDGAQWDTLGGNHDLSGYAQLNSANTFTALNTFRANIAVSNGSAAGSSGSISFGIAPADETVQARIGTDNLGGLFYHASTNQPHIFRIGTNNNVFVIRNDDTKVAFYSNNNFFATVTYDGVAKWLGNANTATKLETARTINGVTFDGTKDITIEASGGGAATAAAAAQKRADEAYDLADAAKKAADAAQNTADAAQEAANSAANDATNALTKAESALTKIEQLSVLNYYNNVTEATDVNTLVDIRRWYLQASNNPNAPETNPGFLNVDNDYNDSVCKQLWVSETTGAIYNRFGQIVENSDPATVSSWSEWYKLATKADIDGTTTDLTKKITTVANNLATHEADFNNPHKVTAEQLGLTTVYQYKGSVATYADLPTTGQKVGDVWNVETADPDHGIKAGDNVAWDGAQWDTLGGNHDLSGYAQLNSANTFTALNTFRANIAVSNGSAAGSSGSISFGIAPADETVQARIGTDNLGGLFYHASTNQPHIFRIGTNNNVFVIRNDDTKVAFYSNNNFFATVTYDGVAKWLGNANTATKLETARTINGVTFDGTKDITIEASGGGDVTAAGDNNFTGTNTFNKPITVRDGALAGIGGTIILGTKPNSATTQAKINSTTTGAMYYTATEGLAHFFNVGTAEVATIGGTATTATLDFLSNNILKYSTSSGLRVGGGGTSKIIGFYPEAADNTAGMRLSNQAEAISTDYSIFSLQNNSAISYTKNAALQVGNFKILEVDRNNNNVTIKADSNGQILFTPNNLASNTSSIDSNGNFYISQGLTVGSTLNTGTSNGVIRAGNNESCLYFTGTAENTYYAMPNTGNTINYQSAANCYLINCSINNPSSLNMNFSNMNFKATVGSVPYMCKTLTFWLPVSATVPAVTWTFPTGSAVYYPKGVAPTLTANANNIINVIAVVDDTGSFSIQVCDTVVLPYSG